jgi:elongation factor P
MAKIANDVRVGNIIVHDKRLWRVLKTEHVKPGKGGAFCQMELKDIKVGTKLNERFRSSEQMDIAIFEEQEAQYLFTTGDVITVMDNTTYEQTELNKELFSGNDIYLKDGMTITLELVQGEIVAAKVPAHVTLEVTEAEAVVKGQTASGSNKPAILENGVRVMVPQFINAGDRIIVHTENQTYVKRAE